MPGEGRGFLHRNSPEIGAAFCFADPGYIPDGSKDRESPAFLPNPFASPVGKHKNLPVNARGSTIKTEAADSRFLIKRLPAASLCQCICIRR